MQRDQWGPWELKCLGKGKEGQPVWKFHPLPYYLDRIFGFTLIECAIYTHLERRKTYQTKPERFHGRLQQMARNSVRFKLAELADELESQGIKTNPKSLRSTFKRWQVMGLIQVITSRVQGSSGTVIRFKSEDEIPALMDLRLNFQPNKAEDVNTQDDLGLNTDQINQCPSVPNKMPIKEEMQGIETIDQKLVASQSTADQTAELSFNTFKLLYLEKILRQIDSGLGLHNIYSRPNESGTNQTDEIFRHDLQSIVGEYIGDVRIDDDTGGNETQQEFRKRPRYLEVVGKAWNKVLGTHSHSDKIEEIKRTRLLRERYSLKEIAKAIDWVMTHGDLSKGTPVDFPIAYLLENMDGVLAQVDLHDTVRARSALLEHIAELKRHLAQLEGRLLGEAGASQDGDAVQMPPEASESVETISGKGNAAWRSKKPVKVKSSGPDGYDARLAFLRAQARQIEAEEAAAREVREALEEAEPG